MDFGSFLKRRELERQSLENSHLPRTASAPPGSRPDGPAYYNDSGPDSPFYQPRTHSQHDQGVQWHREGQVSTTIGTEGFDPRLQYEMPFGSHTPALPGIGCSRGRGILQHQASDRGILKNRLSYQDQANKDPEITQSYKTSNYENDDEGSQSCSFEETYQSYDDYTHDNAPNNFADDTVYSTQYGFSAKVESYIDTSTSEHHDGLNDEDKKILQQGHQEPADNKETKMNFTLAKAQNEGEAKQSEKKAGNEEKSEGEKKDKNEKADENSNDEKESQSVQHSRGLMGTLICMLGNDALNRKPDPLPPPQPAKLHPKEDLSVVIKRKELANSGSTKDQPIGFDGDDKNEAFDVMELPPEDRDLNPDDFDFGPNSDLYCKICGVQTTSMKNLQDHLDGKNHRSKLMSISKGKIINVSKGGRRRMMMVESELGKKSFVLEVLESNKSEPIIGLSFITEFQSLSSVMCVCNLCGVKFDSNAALSHVCGSKHRFQYMKEKRPSEYMHIKRFGGKKSQLVSFLQELSVDVEKEDTRGEPVIKVFDDKAKSFDLASQGDNPARTRQKDKKDDGYLEKQNSEGKEQRNSKEKDNKGLEEDSDLIFNQWVEAECTKSREAREQRKSPSPPPRRERNDDLGHSYDRGEDHPKNSGPDGRRDHYLPVPPRFPQERFGFRGPRPPWFPLNHPNNRLRCPPFPPRPLWDPCFNEPYRGPGNFPPDGPPRRPGPFFDEPFRGCGNFPPDGPSGSHLEESFRGRGNFRQERPSGHEDYSSWEREGSLRSQDASYLDPDPVKRLDMLKRARLEAGSVLKTSPEEPYLDPDPLKRIRKREAVQKPKVIDYSHGTAMNERRLESSDRKKSDKWEDDIKSILGYYKSKGIDSLATLSDPYLSPKRKLLEEKKPGKSIPFSKSYLDIPENKKRLQDLRKKAKSPPIPGIERRPEDYSEICKRSRSSSSSSTASSHGSPKRKKGKNDKPRDYLTICSSPPHNRDWDSTQSKYQSRSRSPLSFLPRQSRSSRSPKTSRVAYHRNEKDLSCNKKRDEKETCFNKREQRSSTSDRKCSQKEIVDRPGSAKNPIRLFNDDKKGKDPIFPSGGPGEAHYSEERREEKRYELNKGFKSNETSRPKGDIYKLSKIKNRDYTSRDREGPSQLLPSEKKNQRSSETKGPPHVSPLRNQDYKLNEKEESPLRDFGGRLEEGNVKQEIFSEQKTPFADDSEDAQADRIADMLLTMSSVLTTSGDTQATLQALLSNPEVAETILKAQAEIEKKSSAKSYNQRSPSVGHCEGHGQNRPHSSSHSRSQKESISPSKSRERKSHAPNRERVVFSLSGKTGRGSLQQSTVFGQSSDEEAD